jgi:hypothetical protein
VGGDSITRETKPAAAEIVGVSVAGLVVEQEVGVTHLAAEVVTLVATDGAVVSALLELDFMSCCPPIRNLLHDYTQPIHLLLFLISVIISDVLKN